MKIKIELMNKEYEKFGEYVNNLTIEIKDENKNITEKKNL